MKKILVFSLFAFILLGCNPNPNKETRIQKLESDLTALQEQVNQLNNKVIQLERKVEELESIKPIN